MKKLAILFVVALLSLALTACSESPVGKETYNPQTGTSTPNNETSTSTESSKSVFALNETAVFETLKITATEIKKSEGTDFFKPKEGNTYIGVKFIIENISDEEQAVSSILLFDAYADDTKCDYSFSANSAFNEGTLDGTILAGKKLEGYYAVEVSSDTKVVELSVKSDWLSSTSALFKIDVPA